MTTNVDIVFDYRLKKDVSDALAKEKENNRDLACIEMKDVQGNRVEASLHYVGGGFRGPDCNLSCLLEISKTTGAVFSLVYHLHGTDCCSWRDIVAEIKDGKETKLSEKYVFAGDTE